MADVVVVTTTDQKPMLKDLIKNLPAIISGSVTDVQGIGNGFRSRIGYTILSLILPNFDELGQGLPGIDGTKWPPLSKEYLAYSRRFGSTEKADLRKQAGVSKQHQHAPGDKKGLLTTDQLKLWRRTYADRLAWYIMRESDDKAKAHAAAVAWIVVKRAGAKTKLDVYGNRKVTILVDTGRLRGSLQPGYLQEPNGPQAEYVKPAGKGGPDQVFENNTGELIVGTNVQYASAHHNAKGKRPKRRLWPNQFPDSWWQEILGAGVSGLLRIAELFGGGKGI